MNIKHWRKPEVGHCLYVPPDEYALHCAIMRESVPGISAMELAAGAINGAGGQYDRTRTVTVMTHWTGRHYIQGHHGWSHCDWVFDDDFARKMELGGDVPMELIPRDEMYGWYRCCACGLVVHDPKEASCSKSCPVCEVLDAEFERGHGSNDRLRFGMNRMFGADPNRKSVYNPNRAYDAAEGPPDEMSIDNLSTLMVLADQHNTIARAAICVVYFFQGQHYDNGFKPAVLEMLQQRTRPGASTRELTACAEHHLSVARRCIDKALSSIRFTG